MKDFFEDHGGYLYHIELQPTMDDHSRRIVMHGGELGTLLFHQWQFKRDVPASALNLRALQQLRNHVNRDSCIQYQCVEDQRKDMANVARQCSQEAGGDHSKLSDQEAAIPYLEKGA
jgi:hypothetical protein